MTKSNDLQGSGSPWETAPNATLSRVLTRAVVAHMLRLTVGGVRYYQRKGVLHTDPDLRGVHRFRRDEVEALARYLRRKGHRTNLGASGDLVAQVFRLFREGQSLSEICIKTEETPATIRDLWLEFKRPLGATDAEPVNQNDLSEYQSRAREDELEILARRARRRREERE
jgi:hypothetical protein